jgi:hypothetical protein
MNQTTTKDDPILEQVRAAKRQQDAEDAAALQALSNPLPGPTLAAMAVQQDIPVGRWKVRPVCDGDFELLVELDHPLKKVMQHQFDMAYHGKNGGEAGFEDYSPRGPSMWQLAWQFTRPAKVVRKALRNGGKEGLALVAEDEFFEETSPTLVALYLAIAEQIGNSWKTVISYGPDNRGEDAAADAPVNPTTTSSAPEPTASAGASTSVAR